MGYSMKIKANALLVLLLLSSSYGFASEKNFPEWVTKTPNGHSSYCQSLKVGKQLARTVALQFAKEELISRESVATIQGSEAVIENGEKAKYNVTAEIAMLGEDVDMLVVNENLVGNQICVLVTLK